MSNYIIKNKYVDSFKRELSYFKAERWVIIISTLLAIGASVYFYIHGYIVAYGDAESHINIAKRVIDSLTPGFAQLGGIWLPLPHILLLPFVYSNFLWRTGLAGSIVSGIAFVISSFYIYKLTLLLTKNRTASFIAFLVFALNPNILYMQSTPMTELPLIVFFILSSYFFILFLSNENRVINLILAGIFGFCASLSRYDGWALVLMEAGILFLYYFPYKLNVKNFIDKLFNRDLREVMKNKGDEKIIELKTIGDSRLSWEKLDGRLVLFCTLAFFGVLLWFTWDWLILGDPLYFTHSQFSANSQQQGWLAKGQLPAYHNIFTSLLYYSFTAFESGGMLLAITATTGLIGFVLNKDNKDRLLITLLLLVPFIFNVTTLFLGQSLIFLPGLTPPTFEWTLFNVRYGVLMVPVFAFFIGYLFYRSKLVGKSIIVGALIMQCVLFSIGFSSILSLDDGVSGLSSFIAKVPDAQGWLEKNYDGGPVLMDDYKRIISIVRIPIPMEQLIYIGTQPYWDESLRNPEKYAKWIIMQHDDTVWATLYNDPRMQGELYKYFKKVYTSEDMLIFERNDVPAGSK